MKKNTKAVDILRTVLIALFFIAAISMVFLHFIALRQKNENASDASDFNVNLNLRSDAKSSYSSLAKDTLLPSSVAVKKAGRQMFAITSGSDYITEVYSLLGQNLAYILGDSCIAETETDPKAFDNALSSENLIYIKYHTSLPGVLIYIHALGDISAPPIMAIGEKTRYLYISELIIFPLDSGKDGLIAMARSSHGETTRFNISESPTQELADTDDFDIYREAEIMTPASFAGADNSGAVLASTLVYDVGKTYYKANVTQGSQGLSQNSELQAELAALIDINPDKTGSYYDESIGGTVYMATHGTLTVCDESIVYSTANNTGGGVELSYYSGKASGEEHAMYECLSIAESLTLALRTLGKDSPILGGEAEIQITDLYRSGEKLILEYSYFYDNIPISDYLTAIRMELTSSKLTKLELSPYNATVNKAEQQKCIAPLWILNIMKSNINDEADYTIVYKYTETENGSYEAEWIPTRIKK